MFDSGDERDRELVNPFRAMTEDQLAAQAGFLQAQRSRIDAEEAELLHEVQRRRSVSISPFRDTAAWLRHHTGIARSTARIRAETARELVLLAGAHAELGRGTVTFDHVRALAEHANSPNRDQVLEDQVHLTALARRLSADDFRDALAEWARDLDEQRQAGLSEHERQRAKRRLTRGRSPDGLARTTLDLDDESDAVVYGALRAIVAEMNRADRKANLPPEQQRSSRQTWADAAEELARRARGADVITKHKARPTILALTDMSVLWDQLRVRGYCELEDGTKITARQLRRLACEADIIPMILDSDGVCLDMGRAVRLATYEQRLALHALHPTCAVEGCDMDFNWCEVHHLRPWEPGGFTDLDNLVPLCTLPPPPHPRQRPPGPAPTRPHREALPPPHRPHPPAPRPHLRPPSPTTTGPCAHPLKRAPASPTPQTPHRRRPPSHRF